MSQAEYLYYCRREPEQVVFWRVDIVGKVEVSFGTMVGLWREVGFKEDKLISDPSISRCDMEGHVWPTNTTGP